MDRISLLKKYTEKLEFHLTEKESDVFYDLQKDKNNNDIHTLLINSFNIKKINKDIDLISLLKDKNIDFLKENFDLHFEVDHYMLEKGKYKINVSINLNKVFDEINKSKLSEKIKIIRIEDEYGDGVYSKIGYILKGKCRIKNPIPQDDDNIMLLFTDKYSYYREWFFGFKNKEQLKNWFSDDNDIEQLKVKNMKVVEYTVPKIFLIESNKQVIFKKEHASKINSYTIEEFLNAEKIKKVNKNGKNNRKNM